MTVTSREVLRPTVCNVSKGDLAVMPVVLRKIIVKREMLQKFRRVSLKPSFASALRADREKNNRLEKSKSFDANACKETSSQCPDESCTQSREGTRVFSIIFLAIIQITAVSSHCQGKIASESSNGARVESDYMLTLDNDGSQNNHANTWPKNELFSIAPKKYLGKLMTG